MSDVLVSVPSVHSDGTEVWCLVNTRHIVTVLPLSDGERNRSRILFRWESASWLDTSDNIVMLQQRIATQQRWNRENLGD